VLERDLVEEGDKDFEMVAVLVTVWEVESEVETEGDNEVETELDNDLETVTDTEEETERL